LGCSGGSGSPASLGNEDPDATPGSSGSSAGSAGSGSGNGAGFGSGATESSGDDGGFFFQTDGGTGPLMCQAGVYEGGYNGINDSSKLGGPSALPVSGPLSITLVGTTQQAGEFLQIGNDGTFDAVWGGLTPDASTGIIVVAANLQGQLDCTNGQFSATSNDANWTILNLPAGMATVSFTGTYDPSNDSIGGNFNITSALATSTGTWQVTLQPGVDE
jgi:hypothetical protein